MNNIEENKEEKKVYEIDGVICKDIVTCADWIVVKLFNKFGDDALKKLWKISQETEDKEEENYSNYLMKVWWENNIRGKPILTEDTSLNLYQELLKSCPEELSQDFIPHYYHVMDMIGPSVITRSNKLKNAINKQKAYEEKRRIESSTTELQEGNTES